LAGNWTDAAIRAALERSFFTRLFYICLDNPERSIQRVRERVAQGGHDVPDADVRRRYARSLAKAREVLRVVHQGLVFDNSGAEPRPVFEMRKGQLLNMADEIPAWAATLLEGTGSLGE
jgi:predicted ABC-type ATPase